MVLIFDLMLFKFVVVVVSIFGFINVNYMVVFFVDGWSVLFVVVLCFMLFVGEFDGVDVLVDW